MTTTLTAPRTARAVHPLGLTGLAGGILTVLVAGYDTVADLPANDSFDAFFAVEGVALALTVASVVGLLLSDVAATLPSRLALRAAALGLAVFAAGHLLAGFHPASEETPLMPVGGVFSSVGMLAAGVLVLAGRSWAGPARFTPLLCGLYPFVVLIPVFAIVGDGNKPAIAGFGLVWALFGAAVARLGD